MARQILNAIFSSTLEIRCLGTLIRPMELTSPGSRRNRLQRPPRGSTVFSRIEHQAPLHTFLPTHCVRFIDTLAHWHAPYNRPPGARVGSCCEQLVGRWGNWVRGPTIPSQNGRSGCTYKLATRWDCGSRG